MTIDAERLNQLILTGHIPVQFTYSQVVNAVDYVVSTTAAALAPHLPGGFFVSAQNDTSSVR